RYVQARGGEVCQVASEIVCIVTADPAKDLPLFADVIVDALGEVVIVVPLDETFLVIVYARDIVARVVRAPELFHQSARERIETAGRSEERRVGKECRSRWCTYL